MVKKVLVVVVVVLAVAGLYAATRTPSAVTTALESERAESAKYARYESYGLTCYDWWDGCESLIEREERNPKLKLAIMNARATGVKIWPSYIYLFSTGRGEVFIPTWASDEKIIEFLKIDE